MFKRYTITMPIQEHFQYAHLGTLSLCPFRDTFTMLIQGKVTVFFVNNPHQTTDTHLASAHFALLPFCSW